VLESFSSHLFVRQVNMFILNLCLTFHSLSVLFICFINKSILCKSVLFIHYFFIENSAYSKSVWVSHCAPLAFDELLFAVRTQVPRVTISGLSSACLGPWYGVFEFCFNVLLSWYRKFGRSFIVMPLFKVL
jgi:hypothetical protein